MSDKLGKLEINLNGTVGIVGPSLVEIGAILGFVVWEQRVAQSGPSYKHYEVDSREEGGAPFALGVIVIEQTSSQNVLMTFGPISNWLDVEPVNAAYVGKFWDFIDSALRQLLARGFVHLMDPQPLEQYAPTPSINPDL